MVRQVRFIRHHVWLFWLLNSVVYLYFFYLFMHYTFLGHQMAIYLRACVIVYFFSKLAFVFPLMIQDIARGIRWVSKNISGEKPVRIDRQSRKAFIKKTSVVLGSIPFMVMGYGVIRNIYRYRVLHQKLAIKDLHPDLEGLRIVQISDIHSGTFPEQKPVWKGIEMINELDPDLFVFTGDLVNSTADEVDPFLEYFSQIKSRFGKFSIMGNHDYGDYHPWKSEREKIENDRSFEDKHRQMGWDLLRNEHRTIQVGDSQLGVIGVENYSTLPRFPRKGDLKAARNGMKDTDFRLLLSHDPTHWNAEVTNKNQDIHLTLSGHTHGFQFGFEIPGIGRWSPAQYIYKQWAGLYQTKNQYLYVNRGYGVLGYPGRVGILPEITLIELKKA